MRTLLRAGDADFLALARPLIREPDLARKIAAGRGLPPRPGPPDPARYDLRLMALGIDGVIVHLT